MATKILILGGGFGGVYAALRLDKTLAKRDDCQVTMVARDNFLLFTPMLHEVAASDLDPSDIVSPIRKMLKRATFYEALVESIDLDAKKVEISFGFPRKRRTLEYDHVLIALGSSTRYFDDTTKQNAVELKTLGDALFLRNRMVGILESASVEEDPEARRKMLTFVVAGGGFAGVETIGAMNDFLRDVVRYYPKIDPSMVKVILVHPGEVVLPEFSKELGEYTQQKLSEDGIDVRLKTSVKCYDGQRVDIEPGEPIDAQTLLWAAGVAPDKIVEGLPLKKEKGRVVTNGFMESVDRKGVWAVGDAAAVPDPNHDGKPYGATAQAAIRQGAVVARNIEAAILGGTQKPFTYKIIGQLAAIGQRRGTAQIFGFRFSGFFAWFLWRGTYLWKLPRLEKKIRVGVAWTLDLFFSRDVVQLITIKDIQRVTAFGVRNNLGPIPAATAKPGDLDAKPGGQEPPL